MDWKATSQPLPNSQPPSHLLLTQAPFPLPRSPKQIRVPIDRAPSERNATSAPSSRVGGSPSDVNPSQPQPEPQPVPSIRAERPFERR